VITTSTLNSSILPQICANLGDTRAVACVAGAVKPLSSDHNTSNLKERERVYAMGGTIKDNR
jgi:protein phosphatase 2C family protein 2/3